MKKIVLFVVFILLSTLATGYTKNFYAPYDESKGPGEQKIMYVESYPDLMVSVKDSTISGGVILNGEIKIDPVIPKPTIDKGFEVFPVSLTNAYYVEGDKYPELAKVHYVTDYVLSGDVNEIEFVINKTPDYTEEVPYYSSMQQFMKEKGLKDTEAFKKYATENGLDDFKKHYWLLGFNTNNAIVTLNTRTEDDKGNKYDVQLTKTGFKKYGFAGTTSLKANDFVAATGAITIANYTYMNGTDWLYMWRNTPNCTFTNTSLITNNATSFTSRCGLIINSSVNLNLSRDGFSPYTRTSYTGSSITFNHPAIGTALIKYGHYGNYTFYNQYFAGEIRLASQTVAMFTPIVTNDMDQTTNMFFNNSYLTCVGNISGCISNWRNATLWYSKMVGIAPVSGNYLYPAYTTRIYRSQIVGDGMIANMEWGNDIDGLIMQQIYPAGWYIFAVFSNNYFIVKNSIFNAPVVLGGYAADISMNCTDCTYETTGGVGVDAVSAQTHLRSFSTINRPITSNGTDRINYNVSSWTTSTNVDAIKYNNLNYRDSRINGTYYAQDWWRYEDVAGSGYDSGLVVDNFNAYINLTQNNTAFPVNGFQLNISKPDIGSFNVMKIPTTIRFSPSNSYTLRVAK